MFYYEVLQRNYKKMIMCNKKLLLARNDKEMKVKFHCHSNIIPM